MGETQTQAPVEEQPFVVPADMREAYERLDRAETERKDIQTQLTIRKAKVAGVLLPRHEWAEYSDWRARAVAALRWKEREQLHLKRWIAEAKREAELTRTQAPRRVRETDQATIVSGLYTTLHRLINQEVIFLDDLSQSERDLLSDAHRWLKSVGRVG